MAGVSQVEELKKVANEFREIIDEKKYFVSIWELLLLKKNFYQN